MSAYTWADLIACVDGLSARKKTLAERISELARDPQWWPTVARLRAFRGLDTLTALAVHLELGGDWARFEKAHPGRVLARADPIALAVRRNRPARSDHQDRVATRPPTARRISLAIRPRTAHRRDAQKPPGRTARPHPADLKPLPAAPAPHLHIDERARQAAQRHDRHGRPGAVLLPVRRDRTLTTSSPPTAAPGSGSRDAGPTQRPARALALWAAPFTRGATPVPRPAHRRQQKQGHGVSESPHFRLATPSPSPTSRPLRAGIEPTRSWVRSRRFRAVNSSSLQRPRRHTETQSVTSCRPITRGFAAIWSQVQPAVTRSPLD